MTALPYTYENEAQIGIDLKCAICLEPYQSPLCDSQCGHAFCYPCLRTWLLHKQSCPICRRYFTSFVRSSDQRLSSGLGDLLVRCTNCDTRNIERHKFGEHMKNACPTQPIVALPRSGEDTDECLQLTTLLRRMNQWNAQYRIHEYNYHQTSLNSLPMLLMIVSSAHLIVYLSILLPIALLMYITDHVLYPILHGVSLLIHFMKLRI